MCDYKTVEQTIRRMSTHGVCVCVYVCVCTSGSGVQIWEDLQTSGSLLFSISEFWAWMTRKTFQNTPLNWTAITLTALRRHSRNVPLGLFLPTWDLGPHLTCSLSSMHSNWMPRMHIQKWLQSYLATFLENNCVSRIGIFAVSVRRILSCGCCPRRSRSSLLADRRNYLFHARTTATWISPYVQM